MSFNLIFALSSATQNQQTPLSCLIGSRLLQLVFHSPCIVAYMSIPEDDTSKTSIKNETFLSPEALSNELFIRDTVNHKIKKYCNILLVIEHLSICIVWGTVWIVLSWVYLCYKTSTLGANPFHSLMLFLTFATPSNKVNWLVSLTI